MSSTVSDDGKAPQPPSSLNASGNTLTWNSSSSNNVVGYRIYKASKPGGDFSQVGNSASPEFKVNGDGVYHVKAVDYFGRESGASSTVIIGETPKEEKETPDERKRRGNKGRKER